ncbi:MAG: acyl-CoA dehydrogenase family protein [Deltaproteobacteria bacterium]|jgi:butyryl-CoA dehydrogenase|nr:acyl-CoA dehydrogenase family protein [Deltaproteobacteria bacterium]
MDFELNETQQQIRNMTLEFATQEVRPKADEIDKEGRFPKELVQRMGELGLLGMMVPEEWGGPGFDTISYAIAMENISWGCASTGVIMSVNNSLYCDPVLKTANDAQKKIWLEPFATGRKLGCFGLTEPMSGSDAQHMATRAEKKGDRYILRGQKNFITNGPNADAIVVFAATDPSAGAKGTTCFVVPKDAKGYILESKDKKLGIKGSHSCTITFDECEIPAEYRLGEDGQGFKIAMATLDGGRIGIAAQALGIARAAYEAAREWSLERKAFGVPISNHQAIQFKLADMATEIDAARLLTLRAAFLKDKGVRHSRESAMAKLYASEVAMRVTTQAVQVFGGYGYITEYPVERHFRDAKICEIYEGTSEIQRIVIAANVLKSGPFGALGY